MYSKGKLSQVTNPLLNIETEFNHAFLQLPTNLKFHRYCGQNTVCDVGTKKAFLYEQTNTNRDTKI